jgi:metacaspase-1
MLLTDERDTPQENLPNKHRMLEAMRWLVSDAQPDDSLFFHCEFIYSLQSSIRPLFPYYDSDSGHGGQVEDPTGEEEDGYNEGDVSITLIPFSHC